MDVRRIAPLVALVLVAAGAGGCGGQSKAEKASAQVCSARADIATHVDHLKGLTAATFTVDGVKQSLQAIKGDLSKIADATGDLASDKKAKVKSANETFKSTVSDTASVAGKSISFQTAATQLKQSFDTLATTYRDTLGKLDCST